MSPTLRSRQRHREPLRPIESGRASPATASRESDCVVDVDDITDQLPTDIDALQELVAAARAERDAAIARCDTAIAERDHALSQMDRLRHLLRQLQRAQFGRRSEKLDPEQLLLAIEDIEQAHAGDEAAEDKKDPASARKRADKRRADRGALPAHLPHIDVTIAPEDTNCPCCRAPMHVIGEETSKRLDVVPAQFRVIVTHRPKYACRACTDGVVQAPAPERLIKGGLPTEAMVAFVLVAKYAWHLPLYRQAQMLLAQGIDIKRAVLAFWVGYAAAELHPLWLRLREIILTAGKIAVDETTAPVLDPGRGRTKKGFFWAIARDDRPWGGTDPPAVAYTYAPGRGAVHALKLLDGYRGIVQCDGYAAYKTIAHAASDEAITLAFCWSHLRRRFFDIAESGPAPIASEALARIAALYAIEKTIRGRSADERRAVRQTRSKPLVLALKAWFEQQLTRVSGKATIAEHIRYALNHWDGLTRFLDDGRIELDTNIVERSIRPLVLNRKNALFAGHDQGAENWACIASLIETCKLCGVEPQAYLTDVLTKLVNLWPASRLDELMPWAWAAERGRSLAA
jgi:transposase